METIGIYLSKEVDCKILQRYLENCGYSVNTFNNKDTIEDADLYITDQFLGKEIGSELLQKKNDSPEIFLPVLIVLSHNEGSSKWLDAGFDDCIRKPISKIELLARIRTFLKLRRQSKEIARRSELSYRTLVESSSDHIFMLSTEGIYLSSNDRVECFGLNRSDDLIGKSIDEVYPPEISKIYRKNLKRVIESEERVVFEHFLHSENEKRYHIDTLFPVKFADGSLKIGGICRDITERVRAERESRLLSAAVENAEESVIIIDEEGKIIYVNKGFSKTTGYASDEVIGKTLEILGSGKSDAESFKSLWEKISKGETWSGFLINKRKDGTLYEVAATISPLRYEEEGFDYYVSVQRDITKEKQLERQLQQAQRLEAIGNLAGGIAHDFNNILMPIIGYCDLMLNMVSQESKYAEMLTEMLKAAERARDLVKQILTFSRQRLREPVVCDIKSVVEEALKLLRSTIPSSIEIVKNFPSTEIYCYIDPTEIHQIIINLCTNAYHAISKEGGVITVDIQETEIKSAEEIVHPDLKIGKYSLITVSDTGSGIPSDIIDKIFDPYFTTKEEGKGTGLGLSVVHGIVRGAGGAVLVYSEEGIGTAFYIYLPLYEKGKEKAKVIESKYEEKDATAGNEKILFLDDDPSIAELGKRMLELSGYKVFPFSDPMQALQAFEENPKVFDLVITDMTMPKMTGNVFAQEILKIRKDIPVIICTGFSEHMNEKKAKKIGISHFVMKPTNWQELRKIIRRLLDKK
ncbi:MAG: PAS domain S-box protein [Candidatus Schekmanbacteria bacterium]|nr:MAG: PAS domain S-box protein [Candidatus Schekmanbacteria bacterium]